MYINLAYISDSGVGQKYLAHFKLSLVWRKWT